MLERYYNILGISPQPTLSEIKKAFRIRAKELHPDVNKSPNAHNEFVLLLEAYEYLVNRLTGKVYEKYSMTTRRYDNFQRWQDCEAARARHRAEFYARKRYEVFTDSDYYKKLTSLTTLLSYLELFFVLAFLILLPTYLTIKFGLIGLAVSFVAVLVTLPITIPVIKSRPPLNFKNLFGTKAESEEEK